MARRAFEKGWITEETGQQNKSEEAKLSMADIDGTSVDSLNRATPVPVLMTSSVKAGNGDDQNLRENVPVLMTSSVTAVNGDDQISPENAGDLTDDHGSSSPAETQKESTETELSMTGIDGTSVGMAVEPSPHTTGHPQFSEEWSDVWRNCEDKEKKDHRAPMKLV